MSTSERDRFRSQASPTARTRRIRAGADRDDARREAAARQSPEPDPAAVDDTDEYRVATQRSGPPLKRILFFMLLGTLTIVIVGGVLLWGRVASFNDTVSSAPAMSTALFGPLNGKDRVNVVIVGYSGQAKHGGTYLGDSINILSIDPASDTTTIIPVPRDLWIEGMADMPGNGKINQAFALGWQQGGADEAGAAMARILSDVTGLRIDHWMAIDFDGFKEMVNAVGGVTVKNPRAFSYTWNANSFHAQNWNGGHFKKGTLHLSGRRALAYARVRYTSLAVESSDFARSIRQQRIMSALRSKVGSGGIGSIGPGLSLMDALSGRMHTDLSAIDLFLLSGHLHPDRRIEMKEGVALEATTNTDGEYILVVIGRQTAADYQPLKQYLATQLAEPVQGASASSGS